MCLTGGSINHTSKLNSSFSTAENYRYFRNWWFRRKILLINWNNITVFVFRISLSDSSVNSLNTLIWRDDLLVCCLSWSDKCYWMNCNWMIWRNWLLSFNYLNRSHVNNLNLLCCFVNYNSSDLLCAGGWCWLNLISCCKRSLSLCHFFDFLNCSIFFDHTKNFFNFRFFVLFRFNFLNWFNWDWLNNFRNCNNVNWFNYICFLIIAEFYFIDLSSLFDSSYNNCLTNKWLSCNNLTNLLLFNFIFINDLFDNFFDLRFSFSYCLNIVCNDLSSTFFRDFSFCNNRLNDLRKGFLCDNSRFFCFNAFGNNA